MATWTCTRSCEPCARRDSAAPPSPIMSRGSPATPGFCAPGPRIAFPRCAPCFAGRMKRSGSAMQEIAPRVAVIPTLIANAYLVGDDQCWVLVDACTPGNEKRLRKAAERRFGRGSRPCAILLTHGHFDHAGSAGPLADAWNVPIYAHAVEIPYLTGKVEYPPF